MDQNDQKKKKNMNIYNAVKKKKELHLKCSLYLLGKCNHIPELPNGKKLKYEIDL